METEVKLLLGPGSRAIVEAHPALAASKPRRSHDVSTYYDTPDFSLRRRGVSLRIRKSRGTFVQTVKHRGGSADFASRGEWEWAVDNDALDREALRRDEDALSLVAHDLDRLAPVFVTDVKRTARLLRIEEGTTLEAAIDEGEVRAGDKRHPLCEIELELKEGATGPMFRLAADLTRRAALRFGPDSKAERGYALLTDDPSPRPGVTDLALPDGITLGQAFPLMLAAGARDFAADLSGAAKGQVEGIHRLRAAIRKMRTLFVLFAPYLDSVATDRFNAELRDLGRVLGDGRDWDVFLTETLAEAEAALGAEPLGPLREAAAARDRDAHGAVTAAILGPLPTDLLIGLSLWTAGRGWLRDGLAGPGTAADEPLADLLPDLLDQLERKVMKRGRHLTSRDTEQLHGLRKSLKKLRYASQDVSSLFEPKMVERYVSRIKKVLGDLGRINDAAVTATRVEDLATSDRPDLAPAAAALFTWNEKRRKAATRDLAKRWRRFRNGDPFWA